jgi:hypothetical protein
VAPGIGVADPLHLDGRSGRGGFSVLQSVASTKDNEIEPVEVHFVRSTPNRVRRWVDGMASPRASQLEPDQRISGRDAHVAGFWDVGGVASATLAGFPRMKSLPGVIGTGGRLGFVWIQDADFGASTPRPG